MRIFKTTGFLSGLIFLLAVSPAWAETGLSGFWAGVLTYKGADLPLRLAVGEGDEGLNASLDIPSLVYAGQAVLVEATGEESYKITFPFGIGEIEVRQTEAGNWVGDAGEISLVLAPSTAPPYSTGDISFGAVSPAIEGTLYLPQGIGPFPLVVLIAGSGKANRGQWSYASWADFYARLGIAAFVYDRRPEMTRTADGRPFDPADHAGDLAEAIGRLKTNPAINAKKIGIVSHSRGAWIAMALGDLVPDLAFMVFLSPAPVTPAEQTVDSNLTGMDQDGLGSSDLAAARNYFRLYFYVARTGQGWDLLEPVISEAQDTVWGQYVDQPRILGDLDWWNANMDFPAINYLRGLKMPVLAIWGGADFITPYAKYQGIFRYNLEIAGNNSVTTLVFPDADHRIEIDPGTDSQGNWHWFGLAPGSLKVISEWVWEIIE